MGRDLLYRVAVEEYVGGQEEVKAGTSLAYFKLMERKGVFQVAIMDILKPILPVPSQLF